MKPKFDPSKPFEEAPQSAKPKFDPSKPFEEAKAPVQTEDPNAPGKLESLLRGGVQGASFGFADEATAGIESLFTKKTYDQSLQEARANNRAAEDANPMTYLGGNVVGSIVSPLSKIGAGAGIVKGVAQGAGQGLLQAYGHNEDKDNLGAEAGIGGVLGGVFGGVGGAISKAFQKEGLEGLAERRAFKAIGGNSKDARGQNIAGFGGPERVGRAALDQGIVKLGTTPEKAADTVSQLLEGSGLRDIVESLNASGKTVKSKDIATAILQRADEMRSNPGTRVQGDALAEEGMRILQTLPEEIDFSRAVGAKSSYNNAAKYESARTTASSENAQIARSEFVKGIDNAAGDAGPAYKEARSQVKDLFDIQGVADSAKARGYSGKSAATDFGLWAVASTTLGPYAAIVVPASKHLIDKYGDSVVATAANKLAKSPGTLKSIQAMGSPKAQAAAISTIMEGLISQRKPNEN